MNSSSILPETIETTKCPKCGSEDIDYLTRVIGYLKRVSKFSSERIKEANKRYYA